MQHIKKFTKITFKNKLHYKYNTHSNARFDSIQNVIHPNFQSFTLIQTSCEILGRNYIQILHLFFHIHPYNLKKLITKTSEFSSFILTKHSQKLQTKINCITNLTPLSMLDLATSKFPSFILIKKMYEK